MQSKDKKHSMPKLEVFETIRPLMVRLGLHSYNLDEPQNEFFSTFASYYIMVVSVLLFIISSSLYIYKIATDFSAVPEPLLVICGGIQLLGHFTSLGLNKRNVKLLQVELQQHVDEIRQMDIFKIYSDTEQKCRQYADYVFYYFWLHPVMFGGSLLYAFYSLYIGNTDTTTWILNYKLWVPFDTTTVPGFFELWLVSIQIGIPYSLGMISPTQYFVGCCCYIIGMCKHFDFEVLSTKTNGVKKIDKHLSDVVNLHNKIFEIFRMVAVINSGGIFWLLPLNVAFFASALYNAEHMHFDFVMLVFQLICISSSVLWPLLYCYFATIATNRISMIGDSAYDTNWFEYPPKLQKYMVLIIARSHETIYFTGLNLVYCTLEVFSKLLKTSCSYYILFRSLSDH